MKRRVGLHLANREGFALVLTALLMTIFIGAAVFAIDVGHAQVNRADLQAAADAAALAGIEEYSAVGRSDSSLAEAQSFAGRFTADANGLALLPADYQLGFWSGTAFTPGGSDTNAAQVIVRHTTKYAFGSLFGARSHAGSGTAVAVGGVNKTVTKSSCVSPAVISYQQLLDQLGVKQGVGYNLTKADLKKLAKANSSQALAFDIPNGGKVSSNDEGEFVQVNFPPALSADGSVQSPGSPSASDYRAGVNCAGGNYSVGNGDWVQPIDGQKANQTQKAISDLGPLPIAIQVILSDQFGTPKGCPSGPGSAALSGCST